MNSKEKTNSRKRFLLWGAAAVSTLGAFRLLKWAGRKKQEPQPEKIKMLSQDGQLVEIDKNLLKGTGQKISNTELQKWIKK